MRGNTVFTELSLESCRIIDSRDIIHLREALRENTSFTVLRLENCSIGGSDIAHLRVALRDINTLEVLDLSQNDGVANNGVKEIGT